MLSPTGRADSGCMWGAAPITAAALCCSRPRHSQRSLQPHPQAPARPPSVIRPCRRSGAWRPTRRSRPGQLVRLRHAGINTVIVESRPAPAGAGLASDPPNPTGAPARGATARTHEAGHGRERRRRRATASAARIPARQPVRAGGGFVFHRGDIAQSGAPDLVVVRLASPAVVRALPAPRSGRVLAVTRSARRFRARRAGAAQSGSRARAPRSTSGSRRRGPAREPSPEYLGTLKTSGATSKDRKAPSSPTGLTLIQQTATLLGVHWQASTDNRGVAGYDFYVDGTLCRGQRPRPATRPPHLPVRHVAQADGRRL